MEKMDQNLSTLVFVLQEAFAMFEQVSLEEVILAIGKTGSGKSTLLASILVGPENLQEVTVKRQKRIDYKDKVPQLLKIGHSDHESETFLPCFYIPPNQVKFTYTDIAGLNDTGGNFIEIINQLVNK